MRNKIGTAVGLLFIIGVGVGIILWPTPRSDAIARVEELNGVYREDRDPNGKRVVCVIFVARPITDDDLVGLKDIRPLHRLFLDATKVTDAGLAHLKGIENLEWVSLCQTSVTDEGMINLRDIPTLQAIQLYRTRVTEAGLTHLQGLPQLTHLSIEERKLTRAGIKAFRRTTPNLKLSTRNFPEDE